MNAPPALAAAASAAAAPLLKAIVVGLQGHSW